jgi:hypothetical protein
LQFELLEYIEAPGRAVLHVNVNRSSEDLTRQRTLLLYRLAQLTHSRKRMRHSKLTSRFPCLDRAEVSVPIDGSHNEYIIIFHFNAENKITLVKEFGDSALVSKFFDEEIQRQKKRDAAV